MKLTQVSGSISLDMGKVVRETTREILAELVREFQPAESEQETTILAEVSAAVAARIGDGLANKLEEISEAAERITDRLENLENLVRAEAERGQRLDGAQVTGQIRDEVSWDEASARADARLAEARQGGTDDSWWEADQ